MSVDPTPDGALRVRAPTSELRYDIGNPRLFAALDGTGDVLYMRLPEGLAVLTEWHSLARINLDAVTWDEAEVLGRSFTLRGHCDTTFVRLRAGCSDDSPLLALVWEIENRGTESVIFALNLTAGFDLRQPLVQLGSSTDTARLYRFFRENRLARWGLRSWRWALLDRVGEAQKRMRSNWQRQPVNLELLADGVRARGDVGAVLRAGSAPVRRGVRVNTTALSFQAEVAPGAVYRLPLVVAAGTAVETLGRRAVHVVADSVLEQAVTFGAWLSSTFEHRDPVLRSMYLAGLNAAIAMYKELPGGFAGLWAGPGYAFPPRVYFRDSYWTALPLLPYRPDWVRRHLMVLATGIHPDGACPSGVIDRSVLRFEDQNEPGASDWLPDHQDSPAFFVLLVYEYLRWTGETSLLRERIGDGRSIWQCVQACLNRLVASPQKEYAPNDWADNVLRSEWVAYDLALLVGALHAAADLARHTGDVSAATAYRHDARHIMQLLRIHCWDADQGHFIDYRRTGNLGGRPFVEPHLALDSLLALRFDAADEAQATAMLAAARDKLQTRTNADQPYGDWGVMCCWPPYRRRADLFAKSLRPYNYHNGAEWPYLSAMYAELLLQRDDPDWRYVLTRWWEMHLQNGWLTPVEYHAPPHPVGAPLQGWSGMVVSAMLVGGLGLRPALDSTYTMRPPPWGDSVFRHLRAHGKTFEIDTTALETVTESDT